MRFNTQNNGGKVRHNDTPIYRGFVVCRMLYAAFAPMSHIVVCLSYVVCYMPHLRQCRTLSYVCRMSYIEKSQWKQTFSKPKFPYCLA